MQWTTIGPEPQVVALLRRAARTRRRNSTILLEYGCERQMYLVTQIKKGYIKHWKIVMVIDYASMGMPLGVMKLKQKPLLFPFLKNTKIV